MHQLSYLFVKIHCFCKEMQEDVLNVIKSKKKYCVKLYRICINTRTRSYMMKNLRCCLTCVFNVANEFIAMSENFFFKNDAFLRLILVKRRFISCVFFLDNFYIVSLQRVVRRRNIRAITKEKVNEKCYQTDLQLTW